MTEEQRQELLRSFEETRKTHMKCLAAYRHLHAAEQASRKQSNAICEAGQRSNADAIAELRTTATRDSIAILVTLLCVAVVVADIIVRLRH